jgi:hypothetical protein
MPRGFKRDSAATDAARFEDYRSFVSLPKMGITHLVLFGADVEPQRRAVYARDRGLCQIQGPNCLRRVLAWDEFHMDHILHGPGQRCWCLHNLRVVCEMCHRQRHVRPKFSQKIADAVESFDHLYPEEQP